MAIIIVSIIRGDIMTLARGLTILGIGMEVGALIGIIRAYIIIHKNS